jgi:type IV pilus assembly protein PilV
MGALSVMSSRGRQSGALMIEVLVTIVIVVIGLLALLQMQSRLQKTEMESYQRTQALMLVNDMASRINTNRRNALDYETISPIGVGMVCNDIGTADVQAKDSTEWCLALQGAAETSADDTSVGVMIGGRGCVEATDASNTVFQVSVVWQGLVPVSAPPIASSGIIGVTCGANLYNQAGTDCVNDLCRRYVTTVVRIADLGG